MPCGASDALVKDAHESDDALEATNLMCQYYHEHVRPDSARDLAQYISLALYLGDSPNFLPKVKEAELPPDAANVVGFARLAAIVYERAGWHSIWQKHRDAYARLTERYHEPLQKTLFDTEIYLKLPSSGYLGRGFSVFLEPMGDNRDVSLDSRYWGFIPKENVIGRPMFVYWSFNTPPDQYRHTEIGERVGFLVHVVIHFFDETRWRRTFRLVK